MIPDIKDVLIYSALTQLEYDQQKIGFGRVHQIVDRNLKREIHDAHKRGLEQIVKSYTKRGITPIVRERENLGVEDLEKNWDLIQPFGGDRTFLKIASLITNGTLLMGIKSKKTSYGAHYNTDLTVADKHIEMLLNNKGVSAEKRARISAGWSGFHGELAANDVFIGKRYTMSYTRSQVTENDNDSTLGSNGVLISTYRGGPGWYNNVLTKSQNAEETFKARKALAKIGLPSEFIEITEHRAAFRPNDENILRYKSINTKESSGKDYGIIRENQKLTVKVNVPGCVVSFDGIEPGVEWPRCFEIPKGDSVAVQLSDKPLYVVKFI